MEVFMSKTFAQKKGADFGTLLIGSVNFRYLPVLRLAKC